MSIRAGIMGVLAISGILLSPGNSLTACQDPGTIRGDDESQEPRRRPLDRSERAAFQKPREEASSVKRLQPIERAPSAITVITADDIRRSGVRYPSDVLRLIPGLEVQRIFSTNSNVAVRSFNDNATASQGILGLVNGRQVYNEFLGNALWDQIMVIPEDIERIEVIRGPGSFLYGPNAMHGVVNIVTKSPLDYLESEVSLSTAFGSYNSNITRGRYVSRDLEAHSGLMATLVWDDINEFEPRGENTRDKLYGEIWFEKELAGGAEGEHLLGFSTGISNQKFGLLLPTLAPLRPDRYSNEAQEVYIKGNYTLEDFKAQVTWTAFDSTSRAELYYDPFDLDLDTLDLDLQYSFDLQADHFLTVGAGYRYSTFETEDFDVANGRHSTNLWWGFIQDEVGLTDKLFLTAGLRIDQHSTAGAVASPRAALVWEFETLQTLRLSYGSGFRNPSLRELWFNLGVNDPLLPGTVIIGGNEDLKPESMQSFELGYSGGFIEFGEDRKARFNTRISGYYNLIDDLVEFQAVSFFPSTSIPSEVAPANQDDQEAYGTELEAEYLLSESVSVFANYSYGVRSDRGTGDRIRLGPLNKANAGVRLLTPDVSAGLWATFFDDTEFPGGDVDEYALVNGSVAYDFVLGQARRSSVFLQAFNLLNSVHREHPEGDEYGLIAQAGISITW